MLYKCFVFPGNKRDKPDINIYFGLKSSTTSAVDVSEINLKHFDLVGINMKTSQSNLSMIFFYFETVSVL